MQFAINYMNHVATEALIRYLFDPAPNAHRWNSTIFANSTSSVAKST